MPPRLFYGTLTVAAAADLGEASFLDATRTATGYRLFSLDGFPVLVEAPDDGAAIAVQVWEVPERQWAEIVASEPAEMVSADIELEDGRRVPTLVGSRSWVESQGAADVTAYGSWAAYVRQDDSP